MFFRVMFYWGGVVWHFKKKTNLITIEEGFKLYAENVKDLKTSSVNNRYITEDVPKGLGLLHVLGANLNIPTPVCDSIITLAGVMIGADYFKELEDYWDTGRLALLPLGTDVDM
jgi:hypothetical protein